MLQLIDGTVREVTSALSFTSNGEASFNVATSAPNTASGGSTGGYVAGTITTSPGFFGEPIPNWTPSYTYSIWNSYPIYVYTEKTKKAIEILKMLHADNLIEVASIDSFIELTEKIAAKL